MRRKSSELRIDERHISGAMLRVRATSDRFAEAVEFVNAWRKQVDDKTEVEALPPQAPPERRRVGFTPEEHDVESRTEFDD